MRHALRHLQEVIPCPMSATPALTFLPSGTTGSMPGVPRRDIGPQTTRNNRGANNWRSNGTLPEGRDNKADPKRLPTGLRSIIPLHRLWR